MPSNCFKPWAGQAIWLKQYWRLYGGWRALVTSPYAQSALLISALANLFPAKTFDPSAITVSLIPNILGFTVRALAIILAFSSAEFFVYLTQDGADDSIFMKTIANFVHFICVQIIYLITAILCYGHESLILSVAVTFFFCYAILTTLSVVIQLFQMATVFNKSNLGRRQ